MTAKKVSLAERVSSLRRWWVYQLFMTTETLSNKQPLKAQQISMVSIYLAHVSMGFSCSGQDLVDRDQAHSKSCSGWTAS